MAGIAVEIWLVGALVLATAAAALIEARWARRTRSLLVAVGARPSVRASFDRLVAAQSRFRSDVVRYEQARAQVAVDPQGREIASSLDDLAAAKDRSRAALVEAKDEWQRTRPDAAPGLGDRRWFGAGIVTTWGIGVIGRERCFVRFEHHVEENIWALFEVRRWRWGVGLGAERLSLGAVADGPPPKVLMAMLHAAVGGPDIALRPGFSPLRLLGLVRLPRAQRRLFAGLRRCGSVDQLRVGFDNSERQRFAQELTEIRGRRWEPGVLRCSTAGPAVMLGAWRSAAVPRMYLLSSSGQQFWEPESSIGSSDGTVTNSHS